MAWNEMSPADYAAVMGNNNNNDGMFGNNSWLWIIVLFLFTGWGRGGGWGGGNDGGGGGGNPAYYAAETRSAVADGFAMNNLDAGIRAIQQGICDATYALTNAVNSGFNTVGMNMMQGFNGVERQLCGMAADQAKCCCDTNRAIERGFADTAYAAAQQFCDTRYQIERSTRDITENANGNTRAILDFLVQSKMEDLRDQKDALREEVQALRFEKSQAKQNDYLTATIDASRAELVRRLGIDCPTPAYVVQPPTPVSFPVNCCGQVQFGGGNGGCGCGGYGYGGYGGAA